MPQAPTLTPELLLEAYAQGFFPMASSREARELHWFNPEMRGILPLEEFHQPRSLRKALAKNPFTITADRVFPEVLGACAAPRPGAADSWINAEITEAYTALWRRGFAHSVECWQEEKLVGGLYGVALGGAFFGESMFSRATNASKAALVHLVERLGKGGFTLLDTQFVTDHLRQFGAREIPRGVYLDRLRNALKIKASWGTPNG